MGIKELHLQNFRNLNFLKLNFNPELNIIIGENGSGKTSLLEAIYILSTSKSFRTTYLKNCIHHQQNNFVIFSLFNFHKVGLKKSANETVFKVDGSLASNRSSIAKKQPILLLHADSFNLISGSPQIKRELLDWALFHVKQDFGELWNNFQHTLKQRNKLLKQKNYKELKYWDVYLNEYNEKIHLYRLEILEQLFKELNCYENFSTINFKYYCGWNKDKNYLVDLAEKLDTDMKRGFTSVGVHKSYFEILLNNKNVKNFFSRGQIKNLFIHINIILLNVVAKHSSTNCIFIVDDLSAELDKNTMKNVIVTLLKNNHQIFLTNINYDEYFKKIDCNKTVFHVKHGDIKIQP